MTLVILVIHRYIPMRYFLFIGIFGLMHYNIACAKLVLTLVYCNFLKEVRKWKYMPCFEVGLSPKGLTQPQNKAYTFAFHGLACVTIQGMHYYIIVSKRLYVGIYL